MSPTDKELTGSDVEKAKKGLNRLNDRLFKYIFASEQHKENLIRFLNDVLDDPDRVIVDIAYIDREISPMLLDGKLVRFDVRAKAADGRIFHVEVQIGETEDFIDRCLFYLCANYTSQLVAGKPYGTLNEVIFVGVLDFNMFPDKPDSYHSVEKMLDVENHKCYCKGLEMHFLEIPKLRKRERAKRPDKLTGLERMLTYIGTKGETETLSRIAACDPDIERILHLEKLFVNEPETWVGYLIQERAQTDWNHYVETKISRAVAQGMAKGMAQGIAEGKAEGIAQGEALGEARGRAQGEAQGIAQGIVQGIAQGEARGEAKVKAETALNMLGMGMDKATISKITGLSLKEIQKLEKTEKPAETSTRKERT